MNTNTDENTEARAAGKKEDSLMDIMKRTGTVATDIHPEALENIRELHNECERLQAIEIDLERKASLARKRRLLAKDEMWGAIHASYDTVQNALDKESDGACLEIDDRIVIFRKDKEGKSDGMPDGLKQAIMGSILGGHL